MHWETKGEAWHEFDEPRLKFRYGFASKHRPYRRNLVEQLSRTYKNWASLSKV